ncbi:hypothetical protein Dsin_002201 [Dipteronia sinensis]|uniref:Reverse transcriptase domain-containing protein n=1 Tax=Dipteronia sinensis TaxID=43782 RepID=A0AAE0EL10_9ROSI|nr:hypothetical protein Dsin_002201 [Dipteronia sinensis]
MFFVDDILLFSSASEQDCITIIRVLDDYATASGQVINFRKSAICVSKTINKNHSIRLADIIGVCLVGCHERYLGLPSFTSAKKNELFSEIKDRVWNKIKGWNSKLLSIGGKEILIKAVIQATPTYTMSLFRIPKSLTKEIHSMCARFWWGGTDEVRKIHWGSWDKLCVSKKQEGIGFQDLDIFNRALLAKQGWRLIVHSNSLAARVLKSKCHHGTFFMNASKGNAGSLIWNSLI